MKPAQPFATIKLTVALVAAFSLGVLADRAQSPVQAEMPKLEVEGSCSRGELLVYESASRARCVELKEVRFDSCGSGEFLSSRQGQIRCVGPSNTPWGAEGLLPRCDRDELVVSEGFGKWKCAERGRDKK